MNNCIICLIYRIPGLGCCTILYLSFYFWYMIWYTCLIRHQVFCAVAGGCWYFWLSNSNYLFVTIFIVLIIDLFWQKKRKEKKGYSKHNNYNNNYYYYLQLLQEWCILDIYVYNCFRIESWMDSGLIISFNSIINHFIFCYLLFIATKSNCLGQPINLIHPLF